MRGMQTLSNQNRELVTDKRLYRLIEHFKKHEGVEFVPMVEMSNEFKRKNQYPKDAYLPQDPNEVLKRPALSK